MKNIKYLAIGALVAFALTSCDKDTEGLTDITYYPVITLEGGDVAVPVGQDYVDPGYSADLGGEDVTDQVVITTDFNKSQIGMYSVNYTVTNPDGFSATETRNVFVYDPSVTLDISGTYEVDMEESYYQQARTYADRAAYYGNTTQCTGITFTQILPGMFYVNDIFGGWYDQIRGYGARYDMTAYVSVDNDGDIELLDSYIAGWGDGIDYLDGGHYEDGTITYSLCYAGQIYMDLVLYRVGD